MHVKRVHSVKRYKCGNCQYRATFQFEVKRHSANRHDDVPFKLVRLGSPEAESPYTYGHRKKLKVRKSPSAAPLVRKKKVSGVKYKVVNASKVVKNPDQAGECLYNTNRYKEIMFTCIWYYESWYVYFGPSE